MGFRTLSPLRLAHRLSKALKEGLWDGREEEQGELKLKLCHQTKWSESVHNDKGILWPGLAVGRWAFCQCEYRRMCDHQWQQQTYRS